MPEPVRLIHITPELPPTVGGVADYTAILSRRLVEVSGGAVEPVLVHAGKEKAERIDVEFPVVDLTEQCSATALASTIRQLANEANSQAAVLLEYSGYGYAKRGAPLWLARGLRRQCGHGGVPLVTMFHEISASGPIWSSSFWLSTLQKWIAGELARQSSAGCSNRSDSMQWLRKHSTTPVRHCPVFSNVGEVEDRHPHQYREASAVVFGGTGKNALYRDHGGVLTQLLQVACIRKLVDIGPRPAPSLLPSTPDIEIVCEGLIPTGAVSRHLQTARFGLLCRNPAALTKSGSLAAYLAHGLPAVVALRDGSAPNPHLKDGVHYLSLRRALEEEPDDAQWDAIGNKGWTWYNEHAHSSQTAVTFRELISRACSTHS
jgi:hypothetical protein